MLGFRFLTHVSRLPINRKKKSDDEEYGEEEYDEYDEDDYSEYDEE